MSTPADAGLSAENLESGDPETTNLYGNPSSDPADEADTGETNFDTEADLSADEDPLPDDEMTDSNSTPQGPPS